MATDFIPTKILLLAAALGFSELDCPGATAVLVPTGAIHPFTSAPFLVRYPQTLRYQQVCSASAFGAVPPGDLYLSSLTFFSPDAGWINIGRLQVNLSSTQRAVDDLSTNFADNVGPNDSVVFGPGECVVYNSFNTEYDLVFQRPFIYRPATGNLLIDVRVFDGNHWDPPAYPALEGQNVSTDAVSRTWAYDVAATVATGADSGGFKTVLWFYPIPSLTMYTDFAGSINYYFIEWPTCPTVFRLQSSGQLGPGASWSNVPGASNNPTWSFQRYWFPVGTGPPVQFYRLYWNSGP